MSVSVFAITFALLPPAARTRHRPSWRTVVARPVRRRRPKRGPSRTGRRAFTIYLAADVHKQLRILGIETDRTMQQMGVDAINAFFTNHGLPAIADTRRTQSPQGTFGVGTEPDRRRPTSTTSLPAWQGWRDATKPRAEPR